MTKVIIRKTIRGAWLALSLAAFWGLAGRGEAQQAPVQPPGPPSISLPAVLRAARSNVPQVLSALATLKRTQAERVLAEGAYLPRLTGEANLAGSYDDRLVAPGTPRIKAASAYTGTTFTFEWTGLDPSRNNMIASARATQRGQTMGVREAERAALAAATELYLRALSAGELAGDAALSVERRAQQHAAIESLAKAGLRPSVDALRASVELLEARYLSEMRVIEQQASFAALAAAVGRAPERGLRPEPLTVDVLAGPRGVDKVSDLARRERPELAQLRELITVEQEAYDAAGARRWPTAGIFASGSASYYRVIQGEGIDGQLYSGAAGIYLRWNAADPLIFRQRAVAAGRLGEARRKLGEAELSVRREAVDAAYGEQRARAQLEQTEQVLVAARATRSAQLERYQAGVASLLELLDAEGLEQTARRARIEAARDHEIARAKVLAATGTLARLLDGP